eukprot:662381-Pleurochrysis_carterae.AAC.1
MFLPRTRLAAKAGQAEKGKKMTRSAKAGSAKMTGSSNLTVAGDMKRPEKSVAAGECSTRCDYHASPVTFLGRKWPTQNLQPLVPMCDCWLAVLRTCSGDVKEG